MAVNLPLELLSEIARILHHDSVCLVPYTTVCRQWQAAFEPFIYADLIVYSDETYKDEGQEGISLAQFQKLTAGAGAIRRAWIRTLRYDILVPFELLDWTTCKREPIEQYSMANPVREANDWAFQTAIIDIFGILSLWEQNHRLSLDLGLQGRRVGEKPAPEPNTSYSSIAGDYRHDFTTGRTDAVPPYRARLHNNDASVLAYASCVGKLSFTNERVAFNALGECRHPYHQIWADEWVRPDHLEYIQARREAVSELFSNAPRSLRVLHYANQFENPWKDTLPALNVLSTGADTLAINLQNLKFNYAPPWLPSGQWFTLPTPEDQEHIDNIEDWEEEICDWESGCVYRSINDDEQFHRFFISLGYAARHMPLLRSIEYDLNHGTPTTFSFKRDTGTAIAEWDSAADPEYRPDKRVAKAWGFRLNEMEFTGPWDLKSIGRVFVQFDIGEFCLLDSIPFIDFASLFTFTYC
ncbi:hypothetical protein RU639_009355 [Aspergillus parasiticus]